MFSAFAPKVTAQQSSADDWPMFHADPSHSGTETGNAALTPTLLWSYTTGNMVASSPAVVSGVIYIGSGDDNVYALNATNGVKLWNYTSGSDVDSSPAVANGVIYIGSDDGNVYALNAANGAKIWNFTTDGHVASSPAVVSGIVYIGSFDDNVYALGSPVSPNTFFIIIVLVAAVVIVDTVVFLMFRKSLKTKPKRSQPTPQCLLRT